MLGLKFNGTWRNYQKQVLDNFQEYQADGHVALEAHLGQSSQHTEKVRWANWPNHHKDKESIKAIALI